MLPVSLEGLRSIRQPGRRGVTRTGSGKAQFRGGFTEISSKFHSRKGTYNTSGDAAGSFLFSELTKVFFFFIFADISNRFNFSFS